MTYSVKIEINRPLEDIVRMFSSTEDLYGWMEGFESAVIMQGTPGRPGSVTSLRLWSGRRLIEWREKIIVRNLPENYTAVYECKGVENISRVSFRRLMNGNTLCTSNQQYKFTGIMGYICYFIKGMFRKMTIRNLERFKLYAEMEHPSTAFPSLIN